MKKIETDLDILLSIEDKKRILREIGQDELLDLFKKGYTPQFKNANPVRPIDSLDQQISITISEEEKEYISKELLEIRKSGPGASLSSFIRSRALIDIDLEEWNKAAIKAIKEISSKDWDPNELKKEKRVIIHQLDNEETGSENMFFLQKKLDDINMKMDRLVKQQAKRKFRVAGRVTYNEANLIRFRAARLSLTVADYIRFCIFGYLPFSQNDKYMSLDSRKRFYVSILDIHSNGWGTPPKSHHEDVSQYISQIKILKQKIKRYEDFIKAKGLSENF